MLITIIIYIVIAVLNFIAMIVADPKKQKISFLMSALWPISITTKILNMIWSSNK